MINVAIDARPMARRHDGIARFCWEVVEGLALEPDLSLQLITNRPLNPEVLPRGVELVLDSSWRRIPGSIWFALRFAGLAKRFRADIVWGTQHVLPPRWGSRVPRLLTVHDFVFKRYPETMHHYNRLISNIMVDGSIRSADHIICVTHFTLQQLNEYYPHLDLGRAGVIHLAALTLPAAEPLRAPLPPRFLFALGSLEPRKNITQLVRVFSRIAVNRPDLNLVLAGGASWKDNEIWRTVERSGLQKRVHFVGRISDGQIRHCMQLCEAFVFPSIYEGFGLPALEADGIAPRIVLNDIPVLREVGEYIRNPSFVDFSNIDIAARKLTEVLDAAPTFTGSSQPMARRTWRAVASEYAAVIRRLANA